MAHHKWANEIIGTGNNAFWAALGATRMAVDFELAYGPTIRPVSGVALNVAVTTNTAISNMGRTVAHRCEL